MSEMREFLDWLIAYSEMPLDPELLATAESRNDSARTLISVGHGVAMVAVLGKVKSIINQRQS